jgi:RNase P/RNase MRP subunit p29
MAKQQAILTFEATEFATAHQAMEHGQATGGEALRLNGQNLVVRPEDADRLAAAGISFVWLCHRDGQILTVPVND